MSNVRKILVLAGAREALSVVTRLRARGHHVIVSLPEASRGAETMPVPTRVGRFASPQDFAHWINQQGVSAIMDVSHAFDIDITRDAAKISKDFGVRYLRVIREGWRKSASDQWTRFGSISDAIATMSEGAIGFSNTGWNSLPEYAAFKGRRIYLRQTKTPSAPPPYWFVTFLQGTPPFSQRQEVSLFRDLAITHLICRDVGGVASVSKLQAARKLGIPVLLIDRPAQPKGITIVETVAEALVWEDNP